MLCGWLSPEGRMVDCNYWEHIEVAYELCEELNIKCSVAYFLPDEELVKRGWIKCYHSILDRMVHFYYRDDWRATPEQAEILSKDYFNHPEDYDRLSKLELKFLAVLEEEYDTDGCLIN